MQAVDLDAPEGRRLRLVVRRYRPEFDQGSETARRESLLLTRLLECGLPVPEPVWLDAEGSFLGLPTLVMARLPGRPLLEPKDPVDWANQLAGALARLHALPPDRFADVGVPSRFGASPGIRWDRWSEAMSGSGSLRNRVEAAMAMVPADLRSARRCLIHGDYWAGNTLWVRGRLTGILDWEGAGLGTQGYDVAYCRLDIALSLGRRIADRFLRCYRDASGLPMEGQWFWDLLAADRPMPDPSAWIPAWRALGNRNLTPQLVRRRLRAFIERAVREGET